MTAPADPGAGARSRTGLGAGDGDSGKRRPLVQVERLTKLYAVSRGLLRARQLLRAVDAVSLYVRHGETLGLVGESGCGKTTLGRAVLWLIEPTEGRVMFDGRDLRTLGGAELRALRRRMQIVFQDPYASLDPRMTAAQIVAEGIRIHRLAPTRAATRHRAVQMLERVGLASEAADRYPHELSAGQRQRIGIARALAVAPDFVVCDEPIGSLDVSVQAQVVNLLLELQESMRVSYLFISHDLRMVRHVSHRVAVMYFGRLVEVGPAHAVLASPLHPYTRALLSAVPTPDPTCKRLRIVLEGESPSPFEPPSGCAFHPRCPKADRGACVESAPLLLEVGAGTHHRAACWHPGA